MNFLYDNARKNFAMGNIKWKASGGDIIRCFLIGPEYTPNTELHETLSDIPTIARHGRDNLSSFTDGFELIINDPIAGICDAQDFTIIGYPTGIQIQYVILYKQGTNDNDSLLLSLINTSFTTDSRDIHMEWNNSNIRLFRI
jgi:hypothetical protein